MSLAKLPNPFLASQVDDTVTLPPGSVPDLHSAVMDRIRSLLEQVRDADNGLGLLVIGQTGSGKSHMIAQLRKQLADEPGVVLAAVRMRGAFVGRFWSHARKALVSELLRQYENPAAGANGLLRILRNRFPKWAANAGGTTGGLFDWLFGRASGANKSDLHPFLDEHHRTCPPDYRLDYSFRKVLPKVGTPGLSSVAHDWLRGEPLGADDLHSLGLKAATVSDHEQETESREVVSSILKLAGKETVLLICLDEAETIQAGTFDSAALRQFTTLVTELVVQTGPRLVATFLRSGLHAEIERATAETHLKSNLDKMGQFSVTIPTLAWEQAVRIVACRLEASKPCKDERQFHPGKLFWPIPTEFVEATFHQNKLVLTPRHLIRACAVEFERITKGLPANPPPTPPQPPPKTAATTTEPATKPPAAATVPPVAPTVTMPPPGSTPPVRPPKPANPDPSSTDDEFQNVWNKRLKKTKPQAVKFDEVMGIVVPWLVEETGKSFIRTHDVNPQIGDINLVFRAAAGGKSVGISFCNQEPRSLRWRLDRLLKQWAGAKDKVLGLLVVLRYAEPKPTEAAMERITALTKAGAKALFLSTQQLTELAALQELLTAAQTGLLTAHGKPVEVAEYTTWAKANLPESVRDFLRQVFDQPVAAPPASPPPVATVPPVAPPRVPPSPPPAPPPTPAVKKTGKKTMPKWILE